jgi:acetylornithine deacetylase
VRVLPGESIDGWRARIESEAARLEAEARRVHPDARITVATRMTIPELAPEADGAAERMARALTGDNGAHVVSYQTEAGHFQARGLSTVVCGPGSIAQAHQPDVFITINQLDAGAAFLRRLTARLAA